MAKITTYQRETATSLDKSSLKKALSGVLLMLSLCLPLEGCSTAYVMMLRAEHLTRQESGCVEGFYGVGDEYPSFYHATWVCVNREIPYWFSRSLTGWDDTYKGTFAILGIPLSLVDFPISLMTDTILLPYDLVAYTLTTKQKEDIER